MNTSIEEPGQPPSRDELLRDLEDNSGNDSMKSVIRLAQCAVLRVYYKRRVPTLRELVELFHTVSALECGFSSVAKFHLIAALSPGEDPPMDDKSRRELETQALDLFLARLVRLQIHHGSV